MIVRLRANADKFPIDSSKHISSAVTHHLKHGGMYVVYGILVYTHGISFYLCDEPDAPYPLPYAGFLFELEDGEIPRQWVMGQHAPKHGSESVYVIGMPEWANDPMFYERLLDGAQDAADTFRRHVSVMRAAHRREGIIA